MAIKRQPQEPNYSEKDFLQVGTSLARFLTETSESQTSNPWRNSIKFDASVSDEHPGAFQFVVQTHQPLKPSNYQVTLCKIARFLEPALIDHHLHIGGGKATVKLWTSDQAPALQEANLPKQSEVRRLLTPGENKRVKIEIREELRKIGIKSPVISFCSIKLDNLECYNYAFVIGDFSSRHLAAFRRIHAKYMPINGFSLDVRFISSTSNSQVPSKAETTSIMKPPPLRHPKGDLLVHPDHKEAARRDINMLLAVNSGVIRDLRSFSWIGIDAHDTHKPEDMYCSRTNADGASTLFLAVPYSVSEAKYFRPGFDQLAVVIETVITPDAEISVVDAGLAAVNMAHWQSSFRTDLAITSKVGRSLVDPAFLEEIIKIRQLANLSANRSLKIGSAVVDAVQESPGEGEVSLMGSGIVTELISLNQRALAGFLAGRDVPVLVKRSRFDISGHGRYYVVNHIDQLTNLDRAPFKPRGSAEACAVNQLQLASYALSGEPFTRRQLRKIAAILNNNSVTDKQKIINEIQSLAAKKSQVFDLLYSSILVA